MTPDLIITDINMPKMDGKAFIKHIYKLGYTIPTIITSGHISDTEIQNDQCLSVCVEHFCNKPIDVRVLINHIKEYL